MAKNQVLECEFVQRLFEETRMRGAIPASGRAIERLLKFRPAILRCSVAALASHLQTWQLKQASGRRELLVMPFWKRSGPA